jgi:hypothetical protein
MYQDQISYLQFHMAKSRQVSWASRKVGFLEHERLHEKPPISYLSIYNKY